MSSSDVSLASSSSEFTDIDEEADYDLEVEGLPSSSTQGSRGGGVLGYILGGYVPPGSPNLDPVLERICTQNDTPF